MRFPPAWYPDPTARHDHRWWDGAEWTAHVADAGTVASDPLAATPTPGPTRSAAASAGVRAPTPGRARAALALGIVAAVLAWIPFLGLVLALAALALALGARRRTTAGSGRGLATGGIATALLGVVTGLATTLVALLLLIDGMGGAVGVAARAYVTCLEDQPRSVCQDALRRDLDEALVG